MKNRIALTLWIALVAFLPYDAARGQFSLVSHQPAANAVDVATSAVLELEFNAPIDTTAEFEITEGFFLAAEVFPDPGEPTAVTFPNEQTVRLELSLEEDTQYWVLI